MTENFVLFVLSGDIKTALIEAFQEYECPYSYEVISTAEEARKKISQKPIHTIVMTKSMALSGDDGTNGLIKFQAELPPTITLLQQGDGYPDYLYTTLSENDWITVPFELKELHNRILGLINRLNDARTIKMTKTQLIATLKDSNQRVTTWFTEIPISNFFTRHEEVWSPSDNVDHLIKSHKPIATAMKLPKFTLQAMFGKPKKPSMTYEELCQIYREELAKGAQASGRYLPHQENPGENAEAKKKELMDQFSKASMELVSIAEKWEEDELDRYVLPHPLIGKITIREMLFFTIYHNLRHASQEGD